jgi:ketopantoate hydroxymethyltransferase
MAKVFGDAGKTIGDGLKQYVDEVTTKKFPQAENWFGIKDEEYADLKKMLGE